MEEANGGGEFVGSAGLEAILPRRFPASVAQWSPASTPWSFFFFSLAEWGTWVAVLVWAHDAGGAGFVGVVAAVQLLFAAVAAPVISSIGDRMSRGRALAITYAAIGVSLIGTGVVLIGDMADLVILAASSIATALISVGRPIHASLIPDLSSEPADAVAANVVSSMVEGAGTFLGPGFAGLVLLVSGPGVVFTVLGAGVFVAAVQGETEAWSLTSGLSGRRLAQQQG